MNIKRVMRQSSLLIRLIAVLLLFILIPVLIYVMVSTRARYDDYARSRAQSCVALVSQYEAAFRKNYESMRSVAMDLGIDARFRCAWVREKSINAYAMLRGLQEYAKRVSASRIGIYYGDGRLYTNGGTYSTGTYISTFTVQRSLKKEQTVKERATQIALEQKLEAAKETMQYFHLSGASGETMLILFPIYVSGSGQAVVFFEMNGLRGLNAVLDKALGAVAFGVIDAEGEVLFASNATMRNALTSPKTERTLNGKAREQSVTMDGLTRTLYLFENDSYGLTFAMLTEPVSSETSLNGMLSLLSGSVLLVSLLFFLLCVITLCLSYAPIKRLLGAAKGLGVLDTQAPQDEIQAIISGMEAIQTHNLELCRNSELQRDAIISGLLVNLVEGRNVEERVLLRYGIVLKGASFCVMLADCKHPVGKIVHGVYAPLLKEGWRVYCADPDYGGSAVFVANLTDGAQEARRLCAEALCRAIRYASGSEATVSVGAGVQAVNDLRLSYITAGAARDQETDATLRLFDDAVRRLSALEQFPSELMLKLSQYIKQGDREGAMDALRRALCAIEHSAQNEIMRQYMYTSLVHALSEALLRQNADLSMAELGRMLYTRDEETLFHALSVPVGRACDEAANAAEARNRQYEQTIRQYIEENLCNSELNLAALAEHFQTPTYTMSRTFRRIYDMGFNEYVTVRRMEYAKEELIASPEKDIRAIARESGYNDASYFNKVFKSMYDVTPTQYRS